MAKKTEEWFEPGPKLGWSKDDSKDKRRRVALRHRKGNHLKTARALQALANVTQDSETKRKARADARYFFEKHREKKH